MSFKPKGIIAAMATPMNIDESICYSELENQVDRLIESGIHALFCLGTNGEFYALTTEEKLSVIKTVVKKTSKRVPVYVGTGCITTKETIELSEKAETLGADVLSVIAPYFGQASQKNLYDHFSAVAKSVSIPIILYNIPARTGCNIEADTFARLAEIENIVGIKDSSGNFDNTLKYLEATSRKSAVLIGNDSLILTNLLAGGSGAICGCANIFPQKLAAIYNLYTKGEVESAQEIQDAIRPLRGCISLGNPNSVIKCIANLLGQPLGPARSPFGVDTQIIENKFMPIANEYYKDWR